MYCIFYLHDDGVSMMLDGQHMGRQSVSALLCKSFHWTMATPLMYMWSEAAFLL